jgi:hypothetical protein
MANDVVLTITATLGDTFIKGDSTLTDGSPNLTEVSYLDMTSATNKVGTAVQNPHNGLLVYQPSSEITKRWNDVDYQVFEAFTARLDYEPTVLQGQTFSCSFYISDGNANDLLFAIGVQSRLRGSGAAFLPAIITSDGSGLASSILGGSAQFVNSNNTATTGIVNVSCYVAGTAFDLTRDYRLWPMLRTATNTNAGDYTFHTGLRTNATPWPPLILRREFIPKIFNVNIA